MWAPRQRRSMAPGPSCKKSRPGRAEGAEDRSTSGARRGLIGPQPDVPLLPITTANDSGARTERVEMMDRSLGELSSGRAVCGDAPRLGA